MNGRRILIHAGFPKTGTTSMQVLLAGNRDALASQGAWYPDNTLTSLPARVSHPGLPFAHMRRLPVNRRGVDQSECRAWLAGVLDQYAASSYELLILSHETLAEAAHNMDWKGLRVALSGFDVQLLAYVRVMDEYLESRLEQVARSGDYSLAELRQVAARLKPRRHSYFERLVAMSDGLQAPVSVRSFDAAQRDDRLVEDFESQVGLPPGLLQAAPVAEAEPRRNVSMLPEHRLLLAHVAGARLPEAVGLELRRVLRCLRRANTSQGTGKQFGLMPPRTRKRARALFNKEVPRINSKFGSRLEQAPPLAGTELDYAIRLTRDEFEAIADSLEGLMDPEWLQQVRRAFQA